MNNNIYLVSKIKKIRIKNNDKTKYLVKWFKEPNETWEPIENFPDKIETYPGYYESLKHLLRVRSKAEKDAIKIMINYLSR
tara:strand:+ start:970 stop:1212 length:243 start_codon:yes stop_codon:yes gene_type:complete